MIPFRPLALLFGCYFAHVLLVRLAASPWLTPDLTLVGLVVAVGLAPERWLICSAVAGLCTMTWALRWAPQLFLGYLLVGWGLQWLSQRWDAGDVRLQACYAGGAAALLSVVLLWLDGLWSIPLAGWVIVRTVATGASLLMVQWVLKRRGAA
jgi:hypothetical protein